MPAQFSPQTESRSRRTEVSVWATMKFTYSVVCPPLGPHGRLNPGENMRVFPLSNWTEMDVWEYIQREKLEVPSIYFSHRRECVRRSGQWLPVNPLLPPKKNEEVRDLIVRVRTIGDIISTGLVESPANTVDDIIAEIAAARVTERGSRADDKSSEAAMEDRKKAGYF